MLVKRTTLSRSFTFADIKKHLFYHRALTTLASEFACCIVLAYSISTLALALGRRLRETKSQCIGDA